MLKTTVLDLYDVSGCTLWVEDDLTRVFLTRLWADPKMRIFTAAGRQGVEILVNAAPPELRGRTVVGLIDCDFSLPNRDSWNDPSSPTLRTDVHEFENYLLDFDVLGVLAHEEPTQIVTVAKEYAKSVQWWMTCKRVLNDIRTTVNSDFPADPSSADIADEQAALSYIETHPFWKKHDDGRRNWDKNSKYLLERITRCQQGYANDLASESDEWTKTFSGKEIFRHIRTEVPGLRKLITQGQSPAQNDEDLAKRMVRVLQRPESVQSRTMVIFQELRSALRKRAGLPP